MTELPSNIPLFPLPNVVLFPGVPLPLHIFEPRYRDMVRDTPPEHGMIGMVLLRGEWRKDYYGRPDVFPTGCAGRLLSVESLPDGRYNILLHGVREFTVQGELHAHSYRRAQVRWRAPVSGSLDIPCRQRLVHLLRRFTESEGPDVAQKLLGDPSVSDELLVNFFCYALELAPLDKQALLEADSLAARADRLCEVVDFALGAAGAAAPGNERYH